MLLVSCCCMLAVLTTIAASIASNLCNARCQVLKVFCGLLLSSRQRQRCLYSNFPDSSHSQTACTITVSVSKPEQSPQSLSVLFCFFCEIVPCIGWLTQFQYPVCGIGVPGECFTTSALPQCVRSRPSLQEGVCSDRLERGRDSQGRQPDAGALLEE